MKRSLRDLLGKCGLVLSGFQPGGPQEGGEAEASSTSPKEEEKEERKAKAASADPKEEKEKEGRTEFAEAVVYPVEPGELFGEDLREGSPASGSAQPEDEEAQRARPLRSPPVPTPQMVAGHEVTHIPYRAWCPACVAGRGRVRLIPKRQYFEI